jgi:hypothetical protein
VSDIYRPIVAVIVNRPGLRRKVTHHGDRMHLEPMPDGGLRVHDERGTVAEYAHGKWCRYTLERSDEYAPTPQLVAAHREAKERLHAARKAQAHAATNAALAVDAATDEYRRLVADLEDAQSRCP